MSTGSIKHNIEITDSADAERFVEALEKAKSESEEGMGKEVMVEKMSVENGSIDMTLSGEPAKNFMTTLVQFFLQSGAANFITIEMQDNDGHKYGITVQDCNKEETPTAKLDRQQQEIDRLKRRERIGEDMEVLINGKHHTHTDNPVTAYDVCGNPHTIKPIDYHLYNFTSFKKLIIDGAEISSESEEGMERLNKHDISEIKKVFNSYNDETLSALAVTLSKLGLDCIDTIEAQQQEIEQLKELMESKEHTKETAVILTQIQQTELDEMAKRIERLTSDKDEQAGRIMQFEKLAKDLYFAYINKDPDCPHDFEIKAIERYQALLGGKEDVKKPQA